MKPGRQVQGAGWFLGTIQYGAGLFGGGALWFLAARVTGFFGGDLLAQATACLLLLVLVLAEAWWSYRSTFGKRPGDFVADLVSSAAIAGFGMVMVLAIFLAVHR